MLGLNASCKWVVVLSREEEREDGGEESAFRKGCLLPLPCCWAGSQHKQLC